MFRKSSRNALSVFVSMVLTAVFLIAAVPRVLNYQGKLINSGGMGVNDTLDMIFRLYPTEGGVEELWEETISNVIITRGLFSVELGAITAFDDTVDFSDQYWLEIEVDGEILAGREKLTSSPHALRAYTVDKAIQSIHTTSDDTPRTGKLVFKGGEGATVTDYGDSIRVSLSGGGVGDLEINDPLTGEGTTESPLTVLYDDATIGVDGEGKLYLIPSGLSSEFILNQNSTDQTANFRITGDGYFGGDVKIDGSNDLEVYHDGVFRGGFYGDESELHLYADPEFYVFSEGDITIYSGGATGQYIFIPGSSQNIGIGTMEPTQKLDINGSIRIRGGSPGDGKVLTSDADGVGSWQEISAGIDGSGTENYISKWTATSGLQDSDIFEDATGVGIGTSSPEEKLDISGNVAITGQVYSRLYEITWP